MPLPTLALDQQSVTPVSISILLSGSSVPPTARSGYIESEGYPEGYPNMHEQVMSSSDLTKDLKTLQTDGCRNGT